MPSSSRANKTAELISQAIEDALKPVSARVKTLTVDNSKEFAYHQKVDAVLNIQTFCADPYCSWQRGSNESFNGLMRQCIPKKRRMQTVIDEGLAMIVNTIESPTQKAVGLQDCPRGIPCFVRPRCTSYLNPPTFSRT
jgi:IS30 family transposase